MATGGESRAEGGVAWCRELEVSIECWKKQRNKAKKQVRSGKEVRGGGAMVGEGEREGGRGGGDEGVCACSS